LASRETGKTAIAEGLAHRIVRGDVTRIPEIETDFLARYGRYDCGCKIQKANLKNV
jgi:hypothetical protein